MIIKSDVGFASNWWTTTSIPVPLSTVNLHNQSVSKRKERDEFLSISIKMKHIWVHPCVREIERKKSWIASLTSKFHFRFRHSAVLAAPSQADFRWGTFPNTVQILYHRPMLPLLLSLLLFRWSHFDDFYQPHSVQGQWLIIIIIIMMTVIMIMNEWKFRPTQIAQFDQHIKVEQEFSHPNYSHRLGKA